MQVARGLEIPMDELVELCLRYSVRELALFGSVLRDDFRDQSDIDVLVEFDPDAPVGFLEHFGLQEELSLLLGREVDLISKRGLKPAIRRSVLDSALVLYAA